MNTLELIKLLSGEMPPGSFSLAIKDEIDTYIEACKKKGGSVDIYVSDPFQKMDIGKDQTFLLCRMYLDKKLSEWEIYYICDVLTLLENVNFENENIREIVEEMTDPEVNGELSIERVNLYLSRLGFS